MKWLFLCIATLFAAQEIPDTNTLKIETPALQKRETKKVRLDNGLEVLLISDPDTDQSAAALAVGVGSWNDPAEYPGMAHFLEHMLFMGSKTYPEEDGFMHYVREHQGTMNAYTSTEHTVYMFSITNENFTSGLNRFSHLFRDPLFSASGVGRELHAVDQEHSKNIENDGWRLWMTLKTLGNQNHPFAAFSTGNAETLGNIPREAVIKWYHDNYSANQMHLVVYSYIPMHELQPLVEKEFSPIVNTDIEPLPAYDKITSSDTHGKLIYLEPVKDLRKLSLLWELPPHFAKDDTKTAETIAYVLGNGSRGSLEELLKEEHLAEGVSASVDRLSPEHLIFSVDLSLTKKGVDALDSVITKCFSAINLLKKKGVPPYAFNEMQTMAKLNYAYQSRQDAYSFAMSTAAEMLYEELSSYPEKSRVATTYSPKRVHELIEELTPETCTYFLIAPPALTGVHPDTTEKWGGARYAVRPIAKEYLLGWEKADARGTISLPHPNPFIPTHLHLINEAGPEKAPIEIANSGKGKAYFWADTRYHVPDISWSIAFKSPLIDGSAKATAMLDLFVRSFYEELSPTLSEASRAGLQLSFGYSDMKAQLGLSGYSERAPELLAIALERFRSLKPTTEEFNTYRESLLSQYESASKDLPYAQAAEKLRNSLLSDAPTSLELATALRAITHDDFMHFARSLFRVAYAEAMFTGNMTEQGAQTAWRTIEKTLAYEAYPKEDQLSRQVLLLPENEGPFMIHDETAMQGSATLLAIEEGPATLKSKSLSSILGSALSSDFFDTLRTKQQTGYIARGWNSEIEKQLFQFFGVHSATHTPQELLSRFELFLEKYTKDFTAALPEERFEKIRDSIISSLKQPSTNLDAKQALLTRLAFERNGNFNYIDEMIATLDKVTYKQLRAFAQKVLSRKNQSRLAVLMEGKMQGEFRYQNATADLLRDRGRYVTSANE